MWNTFHDIAQLSPCRIQNRGGTGIKTAKITDKTGELVAALLVDQKNLPEDKKGDLIIISKAGQVIRLPIKDISIQGRSTQGVRLMRFKAKGDNVASVTLV